jgi:hypothetical protein
LIAGSFVMWSKVLKYTSGRIENTTEYRKCSQVCCRVDFVMK